MPQSGKFTRIILVIFSPFIEMYRTNLSSSCWRAKDEIGITEI
jgi:hypothetical protein